MSEFNLDGSFRPQIKKVWKEAIPFAWRRQDNPFHRLWATVFDKPLEVYFQIAG